MDVCCIPDVIHWCLSRRPIGGKNGEFSVTSVWKRCRIEIFNPNDRFEFVVKHFILLIFFFKLWVRQLPVWWPTTVQHLHYCHVTNFTVGCFQYKHEHSHPPPPSRGPQVRSLQMGYDRSRDLSFCPRAPVTSTSPSPIPLLTLPGGLPSFCARPCARTDLEPVSPPVKVRWHQCQLCVRVFMAPACLPQLRITPGPGVEGVGWGSMVVVQGPCRLSRPTQADPRSHVFLKLKVPSEHLQGEWCGFLFSSPSRSNSASKCFAASMVHRISRWHHLIRFFCCTIAGIYFWEIPKHNCKMTGMLRDKKCVMRGTSKFWRGYFYCSKCTC